MRDLEQNEAKDLPPGADHYRAYVGPPNRFDFMSATQFALLFHMGLRENHKVLDFGCGSLRLGRLLIPFLVKGCYFGIDPNPWLIDDGIAKELGQDAVNLKQPRFDYNDRYDCSVFGEKFEYIIAQSIITHTGPSYTKKLLQSVKDTLTDDGLFLFSYIKDNVDVLPEEGWHYPGCIEYSEAHIHELLQEAGLYSLAIPWYHPGASWHVASLTQNALPPVDQLHHVTGAMLRSDQFLIPAVD